MPDIVSFPSTTRARQQKRRILSAKTLNALAPPATGSVDYFDDLTPGLSLRVTANDARSWTLFYRDQHARQKRLTLGRFPPSLPRWTAAVYAMRDAPVRLIRPYEAELLSLRRRLEALDSVVQRVLTMTPTEQRQFDALMKGQPTGSR